MTWLPDFQILEVQTVVVRLRPFNGSKNGEDQTLENWKKLCYLYSNARYRNFEPLDRKPTQ